MTSHDLWKRPEFIIGETYYFSVSVRQATFRLEATRSGAGVTTQAEFTCITKLIYGKGDKFREPVRLTVEATLPRDPDNNDPFPLGMLFVEDPIGEAMLYIAQSETIVTHLGLDRHRPDQSGRDPRHDLPRSQRTPHLLG